MSNNSDYKRNAASLIRTAVRSRSALAVGALWLLIWLLTINTNPPYYRLGPGHQASDWRTQSPYDPG